MRFALLIALTLVLGVGLLFLATRVPTTAKAQASEPFVLQRLIRVPDATGRLVFHKMELIARRSDGASAFVESVGPEGATAQVRRLTYPDRTSVSIFDTLKVKTTWTQQKNVLPPTQDCNPGKPFSFLRYDTIFGYRVAVIQGFLKNTAYRITRWASPEFGCEDLYYTSELVDSEGAVVKLSLESKMTSLTKGEPDVRLFDPGTAFEEVKPSDAEARLLKSLNIEEDPAERSAVRQNMDRQHSQTAGQQH